MEADTARPASSAPDVADHRVTRPFLLLLALVTLALCGIRTITHADFWIHLASGREILQNGLPVHDPFSFATPPALEWLNSTWLYDVVLALLWRAGDAPIATAAHVVAAVLAFFILLPTARRFAGDTSIAAALILCAWLLSPQFQPRAFIFCLPMPALCMALLSSKRPTRTVAATLLPTQLLWTNLHESFFLGPAITALFAAEAYLSNEDDGTSRFRSLAMLTAGLIAASFINPFGDTLWQHVLQSATNPTYNVLLEWISPFSSLFTFAFGKHLVTATLVIVAVGFVACRRRLPMALTSLAVLCAFALIRSPRYLDAFAVMAFPFLCLSLQSIEDMARAGLVRAGFAREGVRIRCGPAFVILLSAFSMWGLASNLYYNRSGSAASFGTGIEYTLFPEGAARVLLQQAGFPERALNIAADGGFLAWNLPERKIFTDTRNTLYGTRFYQDFGKALLGDEALWGRTQEKWAPEAILINCCWVRAGDAVRRLAASGQWRLAYFDGTTAVFLSPVASNVSLLQDPALHAAGLESLEAARRNYQARVSRERFPPNPPALIGAGGIFLALGRYKEAEAIFSLLVRGAPSMTEAWAKLGICQLQTGRYVEAARNLERALDVSPNQVMAWYWLERAYRHVGRESDAMAAHAKARALNPRLIDYLSKATNAAPADAASPSPAIPAH